MAYHVRGCMAFRSNELGLALIMTQFVETRPLDTRVALGMVRNATEADFHFVPRKVRFPFSECRNSFFLIFLIQLFFCKICQNSSFLIFLTTRSCNITRSQRILFIDFITIFFYLSQKKGDPKMKIPNPTACRRVRSLEKSTPMAYLSRRPNFGHAQGQGLSRRSR
jgi:hypothetical protein